MDPLPPDFWADFDDEESEAYSPTLTASIYTRLVSDATLVALIATYDPLGVGPPIPAVFTDPIPEGAQAPFVVLSGEISQESILDDNEEGRGREVLYDVRCYAPQNGSRLLVSQIAERVRAVLHRKPLSVSGFQHLLTRVSGPIRNDAVDLFGEVLTARVLLSE